MYNIPLNCTKALKQDHEWSGVDVNDWKILINILNIKCSIGIIQKILRKRNCSNRKRISINKIKWETDVHQGKAT